MTVKKLISELKKMPGNSEVAAKAHDNGEMEIQGHVWSVYDVNFDDLRETSQEANTLSDFDLHGHYVILCH